MLLAGYIRYVNIYIGLWRADLLVVDVHCDFFSNSLVALSVEITISRLFGVLKIIQNYNNHR